MSRKSRVSRSVFCGWSVPEGEYLKQNIFDESAMERLLEEAKASGVIHQFDTGRGAMVWFEGEPGETLRELKTKVLALLPKNVVPIAQQK